METIPPPPDESELLFGVGVEGAADFFFGRPLDENPYARAAEPGWSSWREGWLSASFFEQTRGDEERKRWRSAPE
jgi:hypothetical protein